MSHSPLIEGKTEPKRRKTPQALRKPQILALQAAGLTQNEIAAKLGVSRAAIVRDLRDLQPAKESVNHLLADLQAEYDKLQKPADIAGNYVRLATKDPNGATRLAAQDRILEHRGVVTEKERLRKQGQVQPTSGPMFILPAGASIDFGGVTIHQTTISSHDSTASTHDVTARDVTPDE